MLSKSLQIALIFVVLADASAMAATTKKKGVKPNVAQQAQTGTVSVGLSGDECIALGGKVGTLDLCNSGQACQFIDQNQVKHDVCLAKDK